MGQVQLDLMGCVNKYYTRTDYILMNKLQAQIYFSLHIFFFVA